ncbi:MAG: four helix bundle protein [Candidatus Marinimicrobia bacterium]|nr:four helix bundle protein [Candidatus Neomarinimicrobiota bacterium]
MDYDEWVKSVPVEIRNDSLWNMEAYRLSLFLSDPGWYDVTKLMSDKRTLGLSDQLYRSLGSISANLAEGYSRGTGRDRARFYEYSLGSAREACDWYFKGRHGLGELVAEHRIRFLTQIVRLLLTMIPHQRSYRIGEPEEKYFTNKQELLEDVPIPK